MPRPRRNPSRPRPRFLFDDSLWDYAYRCWPNGCPRGRTCCVGLTVEVTRREIRAIDDLMDELVALVPTLEDEDGYVDAFVDDAPTWVIDSGEDGACPFLLRTRRHSLCSIHRLALATGRSVPDVKPAACRHWPLLLRPEGRGIRVLVQPAAERIGCVAPAAELPGQPTVFDAYREELIEICGAAAVERRAKRP
jgi:hypothetical protein